MAANLSRRSVSVSLAGTSALRAMPAAAAVLQAIPLDEHERVMHLAIAEARANPFYPFGAVIVRASDRALRSPR